MDNSRELERMLRKAKQVGKARKPPTITSVLWHEGEEEPPYAGDNEWQLRIMVERSRDLQ